MSKWIISKDIEFCYGHRVWTQDLDQEFALTSHCKCRHLHGHQGRMTVLLEGEKLESGMVTDFNHLAWLKKFMDDFIDHKFIIDKNDPLFESMVGVVPLTEVYVPGTDCVAGLVVDMDKLEVEHGHDFEYLESFFVVDFTPTSENLCLWASTITDAKMSKLGVKTTGIDWWETPKSCSRYRI